MPHNAHRRKQLSRRLKLARHRAKLTAERAAEKLTAAGVVVTREALLAWERDMEPKASDLPVIAKVYGRSVAYFFRDWEPE